MATEMTEQFEIVCLIGSMRFYIEMLEVAAKETSHGRIVLMPFVVKGTGADSEMLDRMQRAKMDLAETMILVTDNTLYVDENTQAEVSYANSINKLVFTTIVGDR